MSDKYQDPKIEADVTELMHLAGEHMGAKNLSPAEIEARWDSLEMRLSTRRSLNELAEMDEPQRKAYLEGLYAENPPQTEEKA